jgi:L-2-hydroxyglutarate oxidase
MSDSIGVVGAGIFRRLVPELTSRDLEAGPVGVRAQVLDRKGNLLDDFQLDVLGRVAVLRNAPSPGATSAMAIAEYVVASMNLRD